MNNIEKFISNFKKGFNKEEIENIFMNGNCYHFAVILNEMFNGYLVYDTINCHFMFKTLDDSVYDITGKTLAYNINATYSWFQLQQIEPDMSRNIRDNCIDLINR